MDFVNRKFGDATKSLVKSPYVSEGDHGLPSPPGVAFHLMDNTGEYFVDNTDDYLVTH